MSKRKTCKQCRHFYDGTQCPVCKSKETANSFQGRVFIADPEKSEIAKKINVTVKGEFALKVR
jgi:DNA-directed RNA polymerase subunit E"